LTVEGHTDSVGGVAANRDLSIRRATAVRQALVYRHFVEPHRLTPVGIGALRPKDTNRTPEGRARNRRVELVRQP
jgi:outer membrane protein OmpA-like peptidoglycan-associated protein